MRFVQSGKLLEVGSSTGELLAAANGHFDALGIEAERASSDVARSRGLNCITGSIPEIKIDGGPFDVVAMYHTIEHVLSPRTVLAEAHRLLRRDGWLVLETPDIGSVWFRLLGARWRQFIPDHRYFFSRDTIKRLSSESGFEIQAMRSVGKSMSARLFASRLGRYHRRFGEAMASASQGLGIDNKTLRLNLGDVMRVYAEEGVRERGERWGVRVRVTLTSPHLSLSPSPLCIAIVPAFRVRWRPVVDLTDLRGFPAEDEGFFFAAINSLRFLKSSSAILLEAPLVEPVERSMRRAKYCWRSGRSRSRRILLM